jgi:hypothetical protein
MLKVSISNWEQKFKISGFYFKKLTN